MIPVVTPPRTVVIAPSLPPNGMGGVATSHYHLYRCLKERGADVSIATFNEQYLHLPDTQTCRFGATVRQRRLLSLLCSLYLRLRGANCRGAYQLFDIIASVPGVLRLNRQLRLLKPSHIIIPDHGAPGLFLDTCGAKVTLVVHHNPSRFMENEAFGPCCPIDIHQAMVLEQRVLHKVDRVVSPSCYMAEVFRGSFQFDGPVEVIPNPVDLKCLDRIERLDLRPRLGLPDDAPLIYIPSAGSKLKGADHVPEIIARLAACHGGPIGFYLSGALPDDQKVALTGMPTNARCYAPGQLDYESNVSFMKGCSFGVSPTLIESFGMAILEAALCGVPMVTYRVGGTPEIVVDGHNGFLVPYQAVDALCGAAEQLFDHRFCSEMGASTFQYSRQCFDQRTMVDRYLAFCHS